VDVPEKWTADQAFPGTFASIVAGGGRCGSAGYRSTALHDGPSVGVTNTNLSGCIGFAYRPESFQSESVIEVTDSTGIIFIFMRVNADGSLDVWRGSQTLLATKILTSPAGLVSLGIWSFIEFGWTLSTTVGVATLRHNGVQVATASGLNTVTNFFTNPILPWTRLKILPTGYIDDIYILNADGGVPGNTFLGDIHVEARHAVTDAVAAGTYADFTPSAGLDHGAMVDEIPPDDDTTYNASSVPGNRDTYRFPALASLTFGTIYGVQLLLCARKSDDIATRTIAPTIFNGGLTYDGTAKAISSSYRYYWQIYETNPATGLPWTVAQANALDAGIKDVA